MGKKVVTKKSEITNQEENKEEVTITPQEEKQDDVVINVEPQKEEEVTIEAPKEKKVKVVTNKNHRCMIGGEYYTFTKGKEAVVPSEVKEILRNAGLLQAI